MDVRIGVTHSPREISLDLAEDVDRDALKGEIAQVLAEDEKVLWITDRRGRQVAVPAAKIAYVEIGAADDDRRIGFGST